jgi:hypothetical protein
MNLPMLRVIARHEDDLYTVQFWARRPVEWHCVGALMLTSAEWLALAGVLQSRYISIHNDKRVLEKV